MWSDTQASKTVIQPRRAKSISISTGNSNATPRLLGRQQRSHSMTTTGSSERSQDDGSNDFRIVINRSEGKTNPPLSVLEVPIPHYRLGTPRFSARGTAFLHSSIYTRASTVDDLRSSILSRAEYDRLFPRPPGIDCTSMETVQRYQRAKDPITPAIFDHIASNPNDPANVRYSPLSGEITAASPARIIAQVTSEKFLDYELLSDFFLTVRAYLSTHDLLAYLMARFEWAIYRGDDRGRIIRVRAFAALRHWVLNYFPYDFVVDRGLRVAFCDRLNELSRAVLVRPRHAASDMKLILDLKKCWNGRCALYWDISVIGFEVSQDIEIKPGGVAGSRDSELTDPSQLWSGGIETRLPYDEQAAGASTNMAGPDGSMDYQRQTSTSTMRSLPKSPASDQSIQVLSCSIPSKSLKKLIAPSAHAYSARPVPVVISTQRICPAAPSSQANIKGSRPNPAHQRSGSLSDVNRNDRNRLPPTQQQAAESSVSMIFPYAGSLIRGNLIPPGQPYIDVFIPTLTAAEHSSSVYPSPDRDLDALDHDKVVSATGPGMKHLLGSIRRALSSKQSSSHSNLSLSESSPALQLGKISAPSSDVVFHMARNGGGHPFGTSAGQKRIDLLCADTVEAFQRAILRESQEDLIHINSVCMDSENDEAYRVSQAQYIQEIGRPGKFGRSHSDVTYSSQSIVIADDTGTDLSAVLSAPRQSATESHPSEPNHNSLNGKRPVSRGINLFVKDLSIPTRSTNSANRLTATKVNQEVAASDRQDKILSSRNSRSDRPPISARCKSFKSTGSVSSSLRKYASFQSGMMRSGAELSAHAMTSSDICTETPARVLRRRPGGDLRANENVHDLEQVQRPKSTGSITTYTDSMRGSSGMYGSQQSRVAGQTPSYRSSQAPPLTLSGSLTQRTQDTISHARGHSSQPDLRQSFGAAVGELAQIPDDDDEGGIEAALLKLEGRYEKTPVTSPVTQVFEDNSVIKVHSLAEDRDQGNPGDKIQKFHSAAVATKPEPGMQLPASADVATRNDVSGVKTESRPVFDMTSSLYADSDDSCDSTLSLKRAISTQSQNKHDAVGEGSSKMTVPQLLFGGNQHIDDNTHLSPRPSFQGSRESGSTARFRHISIPTTTDSFLLDEDEFLSDLSSEMSDEDNIDENRRIDEPPLPMGREVSCKEVVPNTGSASYPSQPPTPPMTIENAISVNAQASQMLDQRKPPTPDPSPVNRPVQIFAGNRTVTDLNVMQPLLSIAQDNRNLRHIPFVLAFETSLLAQQLTLIEKDALNEINWQDLIYMRWNPKSPPTLNWVDYLREHDPSGIDLVTARFNIMVKWVLSELVMTQSIEERALVIIKYIHIAQHARVLHNYATLLQLTIALTSIDCTRLTKTWAMVPAAEKAILQDMEALVTPIKNFHNLRQEMETANAEQGCIPVVGKWSLNDSFVFQLLIV